MNREVVDALDAIFCVPFKTAPTGGRRLRGQCCSTIVTHVVSGTGLFLSRTEYVDWTTYFPSELKTGSRVSSTGKVNGLADLCARSHVDEHEGDAGEIVVSGVGERYGGSTAVSTQPLVATACEDAPMPCPRLRVGPI